MGTNNGKTITLLIKEYSGGKAAALEELMLLTYKELFLISYRYTKDKMLAEDAVSETFLKLIEKIHTVKNDENLSGYLRTIVINQSLDILRKRKKEQCPGDDFFDRCKSEQGEEQRMVLLLEALDEEQREVLLLWQYKYTLREISQKTNLTVNQVRLTLKKAKASFVESYRKFGNI